MRRRGTSADDVATHSHWMADTEMAPSRTPGRHAKPPAPASATSRSACAGDDSASMGGEMSYAITWWPSADSTADDIPVPLPTSSSSWGVGDGGSASSSRHRCVRAAWMVALREEVAYLDASAVE